jgi:hypothetical protein
VDEELQAAIQKAEAARQEVLRLELEIRELLSEIGRETRREQAMWPVRLRPPERGDAEDSGFIIVPRPVPIELRDDAQLLLLVDQTTQIVAE